VFLRGAKPLYNEPRPELLVLDGQQRLTSLLYALVAPDLSLKDSTRPRRFFLDLGLVLEDPDNDEIVFERTKKELDGLDRREVQYAKRMLPCADMLTSERFHEWRDGLEDWLAENEPQNLALFRSEWRKKWTRAVAQALDFEVPLVELPQVDESNDDSIGRICAIFEKLNSTGVELSVYDLLTARLYRSRIRLHDLWDQTCQEYKRLAEWSDGKADVNKFGVLVLRTLALLRGLDPKARILINLDPEGFEEDWRRAARAIERALELVEHVSSDGFGVFDRKWLPGFGLVPVLAALRAEIEHLGLGEGPRSDLRHWYWCNVFLERYSSAVESKSRKDYAEMLAHWTDGKPEPAVFNEARTRIGADGFSVRDSASYAAAIYSGVFCLLALRGARDWRRGESIQLQDLQDHHIFPQAFLRRHGQAKKTRLNSIVNRTLISDETNNKIKDKAPAEYLGNKDVFPGGPSEALLDPHFLTSGAVQMMRAVGEDISNESMEYFYEAFLAARESAIVDEIRRACGISGGNDKTE